MEFFKSLFRGGQSSENKQEKIDKKNFDILKYDGIRAMRIGKLTYAIKCFEEATALQEDIETMQHQANAYARVNRMDDACNLIERVTEIDPNDPQNFQLLANLHYMKEDYKGMEKACQKALELDGENPAHYFLSAKAAIGNRNAIQAVAMLTKAIVLDENFVEALQVRAEILWSLQQEKDAETDIKKLLEINPEDEAALLLKAEILAVNNKEEEAISLTNEVLALNPFNEKAYILKSNIYLKGKDFDKAITVFDEAIEINAQFAKGYHERGRIKLMKGDKDGSLADLKKAMELAPENGTNISGEYHNYEQQRNIPF